MGTESREASRCASLFVGGASRSASGHGPFWQPRFGCGHGRDGHPCGCGNAANIARANAGKSSGLGDGQPRELHDELGGGALVLVGWGGHARRGGSRRDQLVRPLLDQIKDWLDAKSMAVLPQSPMGEAIKHARKHWRQFTNLAADRR